MLKFPLALFLLFVSVMFSVLVFASDNPAPANSEAPKTGPLTRVDFQKESIRSEQASVDVAILLDTSNSMDGLIRQAKSQLWTIVQQFANAQKNCRAPLLRVALFEYGNTNLPASEGYLRQVVPLTDDLDVLSEALFALTTQGGDEYCGQVIDEAITRLAWSEKPGSYKAVFIAGNEPFTQGSVDYHNSCERAVDRGIVINTIHCGKHNTGVQGEWQHGAVIGKGEFFNIDQDRAIVHIRCPQDPEIIRLNKLMNGTYLWYGSADKRDYYISNQEAQDENASLLSSSVAVSRSITKTSRVYDNRARDLIDASIDDEDILKSLPESDLPDVMQEMTPEERVSYLHELAQKRVDLKKQIGRLAAEREIYQNAERSRRHKGTAGETLGDAVVVAIRIQLVEAGFEIGNASESN
jgi:von Willebrand factor type A domain-containing protein